MMVKILAQSKILIKFVLALKLTLSEPQTKHLLNLVERVIVCESKKLGCNL